MTKDRKRVALLANIGGVEDAAAAGKADLEGVGLFRTEFVFLSASTAPTVEEQAEIYRQVFAPFEGKRVVVRTLDAGADKPLAFADLALRKTPRLAEGACGFPQSVSTFLTRNSRRSRSPQPIRVPTFA